MWIYAVFCYKEDKTKAGLECLNLLIIYTHTHTHTHIYIYILDYKSFIQQQFQARHLIVQEGKVIWICCDCRFGIMPNPWKIRVFWW